jgi:hypothetical protein
MVKTTSFTLLAWAVAASVEVPASAYADVETYITEYQAHLFTFVIC